MPGLPTHMADWIRLCKRLELDSPALCLEWDGWCSLPHDGMESDKGNGA
jgi:hypothetical protein